MASKNIPSISNLFNELRKTIIGDVTPAIKRIDSIIAKTVVDDTKRSNVSYHDMLKKLVNNATQDTLNANFFNDNIVHSRVNLSRLNRYSNFEEIADSITYASKALKVLADEINSPNDITAEILKYTWPDIHEYDEIIRNIKSINKILDIEDNLHEVVYETLKKGDYFVEVYDMKSNELPLIGSILTEDYLHDMITDDDESIIELELLNEAVKPVKKQIKLQVKLTEANTDKKIDKTQITDLKLIYHNPRSVIKLQSPKSKINLGYLILPDFDENIFGGMGGSTNASKSANNSNNYTLLASPANGYGNGYGTSNQYAIDYSGVEDVYAKLLNTLKRYLGDNQDNNIGLPKKEIYDVLFKIIDQSEKENNKKTLNLPFRYVPPDRMEHFVPSSSKKFYPYGESTFQPIVFNAKLLISFETALVVKRVTDSTDKRAIYVETGLPRNVSNTIETIKETLKKKKFTVSGIGNVGTIPSLLTSYEDLYIPQKQGKRFIEIESIPKNVDTRDMSEELKTLRDLVVSGLNVPPTLLGNEENLPNKNALSHETILFARTIVSYQKQFSKHTRKLFNKIYKLVYSTNIPSDIIINFNPPKYLNMELLSDHIDVASRLITTLSDLGINKEFLKKKYLNIDWDELKQFDTKELIDSKINLSKTEADDGDGTGDAASTDNYMDDMS